MSHLVTFGAMVAVLVPVNLIIQPETRTTMILLPALIVCLVVMTSGFALALVGAERLLPRRAAHPGGAAAALVLPDADLLLARPASRQRLGQRARDRRAALGEPPDAACRVGAPRGLLRRMAVGGPPRLRRRGDSGVRDRRDPASSSAWSPRWRWSSERGRPPGRGARPRRLAALPDLPRAQRDAEGDADAPPPRRGTPTSGRCATSTSTSRPASRSASWARTARARAPC